MEENDNEVEKETARETSENHLSPVNGGESGGVSADVAASHHDERNSDLIESAEEPGYGGDNITTSKDQGVDAGENSETQTLHEDTLETNGIGSEGLPGRHPETPGSERPKGTTQEEAEKFTAIDPTHSEDDAHVRLRQLCEERDDATQRNVQLQAKLAEYLRMKAWEDARWGRDVSESQQLQLEYEMHIHTLSEVKQQLATDSETARQGTDQLRLLSHQRLDKVEDEWQAFVALKREAAVTALCRSLGKHAAQAKVESTLAAEQLRQDELVKLRLRHIKLRTRIGRLVSELRDVEGHGRDPLQIQFEQLQATRLEQKKHTEKQSEEATKLQGKISSSLELLSNIKEKLSWSQILVQAKREQLAEAEAAVAGQRDLLTSTKQAHARLQRDNRRLRVSRGLLGNRALLRDFEETADATEHLEEQLENLKKMLELK